MKQMWLKGLIVLLIVFSCITPAKALNPLPPRAIELVKLPEAGVTLFAQKDEKEYEYRKFILKWNENYRSYPDWRNVGNPAYAPTMYFEDINADDKKEIIVVLTTDYGTGVHEQQVHVIHPNMTEVLVDNPLAIIYKNVKTKLSADQAELIIGKQRTKLDISQYNKPPNHLSNEIGFGGLIRFKVVDKNLVAYIGTQITTTSSGYIGDIKITYHYKDRMYQAKRIEFRPISKWLED